MNEIMNTKCDGPLDIGDVAFHCALHAQTVLGGAHRLARQLVACGHGPFREVEMLALYVAALGRDP